MKILVINSGSSSLKYTLFRMDTERPSSAESDRITSARSEGQSPAGMLGSAQTARSAVHGDKTDGWSANGLTTPWRKCGTELVGAGVPAGPPMTLPNTSPNVSNGILSAHKESSRLEEKSNHRGSERILIEGSVDRVGLGGSRHAFRAAAGEEVVTSVDVKDHGEALDLVLATLSEGDPSGGNDPAAVAHRIGHGGKYRDAVRIDQEVKAEIRRMTPMIPLHHPAMLAAVEECEIRMPRAVHVAVFDTSFHRHIPDKAAIYGLPYRYFSEKGYRRTGFHGHSHEYVSGLAALHLGRPMDELRMISCHLGNGASLCAIDRGRSVDTTLGMTAVEGLIMGTRSGDVDPGLIPVIMKEDGLTPDGLLQMLYRESGLKAISGISPDMREVEHAAAHGDPRAVLALEAFCYRVKRAVGSMLMVLGGCDVLIFTGGIGLNSSTVRTRVLEGAEGLGFLLDGAANLSATTTEVSPVVEVSIVDSPTKILVIRTFEELIMARQCLRVVEALHGAQPR